MESCLRLNEARSGITWDGAGRFSARRCHPTGLASCWFFYSPSCSTGCPLEEKAASIINLRKLREKSGSKKLSSKVIGFDGAVDVNNETEEENKYILSKINKIKPDLLFVAYGAPFQEKWLAENLEKIDVGVAMVVGGVLDMIVDPSLKPPKFMTRLSLDWFYRLVRQPWRVRRQLALVRFAFLVLAQRFGAV